MKEARVTPGSSSKQYLLIAAITLAVFGLNRLSRGIHEDLQVDWVVSVAWIALGLMLFSDWLRCRRGLWMISYDEDKFQIREGENIRISSTFEELRTVDQDGRGYTIVTNSGRTFRLLRKDMPIDLQLLLNAIQNAEQIMHVNRP